MTTPVLDQPQAARRTSASKWSPFGGQTYHRACHSDGRRRRRKFLAVAGLVERCRKTRYGVFFRSGSRAYAAHAIATFPVRIIAKDDGKFDRNPGAARRWHASSCTPMRLASPAASATSSWCAMSIPRTTSWRTHCPVRPDAAHHSHRELQMALLVPAQRRASPDQARSQRAHRHTGLAAYWSRRQAEAATESTRSSQMPGCAAPVNHELNLRSRSLLISSKQHHTTPVRMTVSASLNSSCNLPAHGEHT